MRVYGVVLTWSMLPLNDVQICTGSDIEILIRYFLCNLPQYYRMKSKLV